jgi:SAM-dependent methyltransferase
MTDMTAFWEDFYAGGRGVWSERPNGALVEEASDLAPGTALELGCGHGGDAIWLAARGWRVTAVDIAQAALDTAAAKAAEAGVGDAIAFERHDLAASMPAGPFDLVTTAFLHSPAEHDFPRTKVLRDAASVVAPGGTLLVIGHAPSHEHHHVELPGVAAVLEELALDDASWEVLVAEERTRMHQFGDEPAHERVDAVVRARRR